MANECTVVELYGENASGDVRRFTCANAGAIKKGTIMTMSDPRTAASMANTGAVVFAGIASADKEAADGATSIGLWENGIFEMKCSGAVTIGTKLVTLGAGASAGSNYVGVATAAQAGSSFALIVGTALETATSGETINVRVNN